MHLSRWTALGFFLLLFGCGDSNPKLVTIEMVVDELICDDGVRIFEGRVLTLQGIKSVTVNINEQTAKISYRNDQLKQDQIASHVMEFGFTVDGEVGNLVARKRLPACCFASNELES